MELELQPASRPINNLVILIPNHSQFVAINTDVIFLLYIRVPDNLARSKIDDDSVWKGNEDGPLRSRIV